MWAAPQIVASERGALDGLGQAGLLLEQWCSAWQPEQSWEALQMAVLEWAAPDGLEQAESRLEE